MGMTQINVTLPETLQEYVYSRVEHGEFGTPSEFVRTLIRRDREQRVAALETEMLSALSSSTVEILAEDVASGKLIKALRERQK
jgi:antitoxin ParD1/3/4